MKKYIFLSLLIFISSLALSQSSYSYIDQEMVDTDGERFKRIFNIQTSSFFNLKSDLTGFYSPVGIVEPYDFCTTVDTFGLDTDLFSNNKTATKDVSHDLDTFDFSINSDYANLEMGMFNGLRSVGFNKSISVSKNIFIKIMDLSTAGMDSVSVVVGMLDFSGGDPTAMIIEPISSNVRISTNSSALRLFSELNKSSVDQLFSLSAGAENDGGYEVGFESQYKGSTLEAKMFATSDDGSYNSSVIDVTQDAVRINTDGANFIASQSANEFTIQDIEFVGFSNLFTVTDVGEIQTSQYPNTRDDNTKAENLFYSDSDGNLQSTTIGKATALYRDVFTLSGAETTVTLSNPPTSSNNISLSLEGSLIYEGIHWTLSGPVITFISYTGVLGEVIEAKYN